MIAIILNRRRSDWQQVLIPPRGEDDARACDLSEVDFQRTHQFLLPPTPSDFDTPVTTVFQKRIISFLIFHYVPLDGSSRLHRGLVSTVTPSRWSPTHLSAPTCVSRSRYSSLKQVLPLSLSLPLPQPVHGLDGREAVINLRLIGMSTAP